MGVFKLLISQVEATMQKKKKKINKVICLIEVSIMK